jgi:PBP1b-binding outer membrane lipoprotein LpoB
MTKTRLIPSLSLLAVLLAACAPASTATNPPLAETQPPIQPSVTLAAPTLEPATQSPVESPTVESRTGASAPTPLPVATSRGPELEATDPMTVSLASGQLQFVEFFRFT